MTNHNITSHELIGQLCQWKEENKNQIVTLVAYGPPDHVTQIPYFYFNSNKVPKTDAELEHNSVKRLEYSESLSYKLRVARAERNIRKNKKPWEEDSANLGNVAINVTEHSNFENFLPAYGNFHVQTHHSNPSNLGFIAMSFMIYNNAGVATVVEDAEKMWSKKKKLLLPIQKHSYSWKLLETQESDSLLTRSFYLCFLYDYTTSDSIEKQKEFEKVWVESNWIEPYDGIESTMGGIKKALLHNLRANK